VTKRQHRLSERDHHDARDQRATPAMMVDPFPDPRCAGAGDQQRPGERTKNGKPRSPERRHYGIGNYRRQVKGHPPGQRLVDPKHRTEAKT
jgi:hypothetical protein